MNGILKKINYILNKKDKIHLVYLFFGILVSSALELVGISAILPIVSLLSSADPQALIESNTLIRIASELFNTTDVNSIAVILIICLGIIYIFKGFYLIFLNYCISKFTTSFQRNLSTKLIRSYLSMPYEYHLQHNSATLLKSATYDVNLFVTTLNMLLGSAVYFIMVITIVIYLFVINWAITLIIGGVILFASLIIILVLKKHMRKVGLYLQQLNGENYKQLNQAFNGIKESKISNTEEYFIEEYERNVVKINKHQIRYNVYSSIPKNMLEMFGMLAMLLSLATIILFSKSNNASIIETFAVFVYATLKLLPAVNNLNATINSMPYYQSSIDLVYNDIKAEEQIKEKVEEGLKKYDSMPFVNIIKLKDIVFKYQGTDKVVLNDVSCEIKKGTSVAFSGVSGAGKTTLIDIILGLLSPTSGSITCDGVDITTNPRGWHENISYIPQTIYLIDDTIKNNVAFGKVKSAVKDDDIWIALEKAQLKEFVMSLPDKLNTVIGERGVRLSGGQRQRIGIARAFYRNTQIMVFDEATSALDYETERQILNHVSSFAGRHTIIIITHRLNTIENCDRIYKIEEGRISTIK